MAASVLLGFSGLLSFVHHRLYEYPIQESNPSCPARQFFGPLSSTQTANIPRSAPLQFLPFLHQV